MSRAMQMDANHVVAAWRTITPAILPKAIAELIAKITDSQERFVIVSSSMFNGTEEESKENNEFVQVVVLPDNDIITLVENLAITWNGLPHFKSGWDLLQKYTHESAIQFALRKLSALRAPLIQDNPKHPLNDFHISNRDSADPVDIALADTTYFFDPSRNRVVIRHAIMNMTHFFFTQLCQSILQAVTQRIIKQIISIVEDTTLPIQVEHIIPHIIPGITSPHIVLGLCSETHDPERHITPTIEIQHIIDPRYNLNDLFSKSTTRQPVGVQAFWDNMNCGRYVTILSVIATRVLSEHCGRELLTNSLFYQFAALREAGDQSISELREALRSVAETPYSLTEEAKIAHEFTKKVMDGLHSLSVFAFKETNPTPAALMCQQSTLTPTQAL